MTASTLISTCPATGNVLWQGETASPEAVHSAVGAARLSFARWACAPHEERLGVVRAFADALQSRQQDLAEAIANETGKPLWEACQEVGSMAAKVELSVRAQAERAGERQERTGFGQAVLRHRPHGVLAVLGPYNFPGHLPNGHIVPALLAGNAVVFKPSEETPLTGEIMACLWRDAGLPEGVLTVVQGRRETGEALVASDIDGVLFTGSAATGALLRRALVDRPGVILALEMGGNNPLVAWDGDVDAAASIIVQSAFITTGQRCSCARRLIVPTGPFGDAVVSAVADLSSRLRIGHWRDDPEPGLGPLISAAAADRLRNAADALAAAGARTIKSLARVEGRSPAFVTPAIYDVTGLAIADEEIFGPVLQVTRCADFATALAAANDTAYGLSGGLVSQDEELWRAFRTQSRAGVVNWNRPTTGASGGMPFGGTGASGNHRPSGYYAADYVAYPVASFESRDLIDQTDDLRGLEPRAGRAAA